MFTLGEINTADTSLLGAVAATEMAEAMAAAPHPEKIRFAQKVKEMGSQPIKARGSREDFIQNLYLLPAEIRQGLLNKSLQIVNTSYYAVKEVTQSKRAQLFKDDDNKVVGITNLSSGKLEKGAFFMLHAFRMQYGVADMPPAGTDKYDALKVAFSTVPDFIKNGEFEFKANGAVLVPVCSMEVFHTKNNTRLTEGTWILDNPKLIRDQQMIEFNMDWGVNAPDRSYLKLTMFGSSIIKA